MAGAFPDGIDWPGVRQTLPPVRSLDGEETTGPSSPLPVKYRRGSFCPATTGTAPPGRRPIEGIENGELCG